jgi:hypothetical protein
MEQTQNLNSINIISSLNILSTNTNMTSISLVVYIYHQTIKLTLY